MNISDDDKLRFNICKRIESDCRSDTGIATSLHECTNYSNSTIKEKIWKLCIINKPIVIYIKKINNMKLYLYKIIK